LLTELSAYCMYSQTQYHFALRHTPRCVTVNFIPYQLPLNISRQHSG